MSKPLLNIKQLLNYIDIRKLIKYGKLLIEWDTNNTLLVTADNGNGYVETTPIIQEENNVDDYSYFECKQLANLIYVIGDKIGLLPNKHAQYRLGVGASLNSDKSIKEVKKLIGVKAVQLLYDNGYDIIKEV